MYELEIKEPDKLFFTSDLHLNHFNIVKYCKRPFTSRHEMNECLINNWNSVVPEDGIVVNCGDFTLTQSLAEYQKLASKLNGKQLLIRGNHDKVPLLLNEEDKFIAIVDIALIKVKPNVKIIASHYPLLAYPFNYNVYGHVHTLSDHKIHGLDSVINDKIRKSQVDVGVDHFNYKPINYWDLLKYINA